MGRRTRVAIARLPRSGDCLDDLRVDVRLFLQRPGTGHNHLLSHTFTPRRVAGTTLAARSTHETALSSTLNRARPIRTL